MLLLVLQRISVPCKRLLLAFTGLLFFLPARGQDNCTQAVMIDLPNSGFDPVADVQSAGIDITGATIEGGESFSSAITAAGQNQKSIWFRFYLPTARSVTVTLTQGGGMTPGDVGFAVYKSAGCLPSASQLNNKLPALANFGSRSTSCLEAGAYLVQVSAKSSAAGTVYLRIQTDLPAASPYDFSKNAYDFGTVTPAGSYVNYDIGCQTIDHPTETCSTFPNAQEYTKSTWHVFTTSSSTLSILFSLRNTTAPPGQKFGFVLYKGNAQYSAVTLVGACDTLVTDASRTANKTISCTVLEPNTTYSLSLLFHSEFNDHIEVGLTGVNATVQTTSVPLCNASGYTLPWGEVVSASGTYRDTLKARGGCDSLIRVVNVSFLNTTLKKDTVELCRGKVLTLPWGEVITQAGTYGDTIQYANTSCDSLIQTVLVRRPSIPVTLTAVTACPDFAYTLPWGQVVTVSGLYSDTLRAANGCDSLVRQVRVTFSNNYDLRFGMDSTCSGQVYTLPWGSAVTDGGTYYDTIRRVNGCDSIIMMFTLKFKPLTVQKDTVSLCAGASYVLPWGATADSSGTYRDTIRYTGKLKCDSLIREIVVSVGKPEVRITEAYLCFNGSYTLPWGETVSAPGTYSDTLKAVAGCDSLVREIRVTLKIPELIDTTVSICAGGNYMLPWGETVSAPGYYTHSIQGASGCDSLKWNIDLRVQTLKRDTTLVSFCKGQTYTLPGGIVVNSPGLYSDTVRYGTGCDSVIRFFDLSETNLARWDTAVTVCPETSFALPWGEIAATPGVYKDTLRSAGGCDSLIRSVSFLWKETMTESKDIGICSGSYTLPWGEVVSTPDIYRDTIRYTTGCDSLIRVVNLNIGSPGIVNRDTTICSGQSYTLPGGTVASSPGVYKDTIRSAEGCDSLIFVTTLSIRSTKKDTVRTSFCEGSSFTLPWGEVVTVAGNYEDTIKGSGGCDSLIQRVELGINPVQVQQDSVTICSGTSYTLPWGAVADTSGVYKDTLRSSGGCDSVIRYINLSFKTVETDSKDIMICSGTYTLPWGTVANRPGTYRDTTRSATGCDSLIRVINLSIGAPGIVNRDTAVCSGQSYTLPGGTIVSVPGTYKDTIRSKDGCDSLIFVTTLSVLSAKRDTASASFCEGSSFILPWGQAVTLPGTYEDTIKARGGCDSLIQRVELRLLPVRTDKDSVNICPGSSYTLPWGEVADSSGTYTDTLHYPGGCDSMIRMVKLFVLPMLKDTVRASFCTGSAYTLPWGVSVTVPGLYADTSRYSAGCDSLIRYVVLQENAVAIENTEASICPGQSYTLPWGAVVSTAGTYRDTLQALGGCDSLVRVVKLSPADPLIQRDTAFFCPGSSYTLPWGAVVNTQGVYSDTIHYGSGCDSLIRIVSLDQGISPVYETLDATLCSGQSFSLPWGPVITVAGVYRDTVKAAGGCDSLIRTATINFIAATTITIDTSICGDGGYRLSSGEIVGTAGVYRDTVRAANGCDSLIRIINLTVVEPTEETTTVSINPGESYTLPWGVVVTEPGTYRDTVYNKNGCDSLLRIVNLSAGTLPVFSTAAGFCSNGSYTLPWGQTVSVAGTYRDTLKTVAGRDSLIREVLLSERTAQVQHISAAVCQGAGYTLPWGMTATQAGTYSDTLRTAEGCDSLIRVVNLLEEAAPLIVLGKSNDINCVSHSSKLTATGGVRYQWWPAENIDNTAIPDPTVSPSVSTTYYVQVVSSGGCITKDSITVYVNADDPQKAYLVPNAFTPDGDGKNDCFGIRHWGSVTDLNFTIYDRWGGIVFQTTDPLRCWDGTFKATQLPTGSFVYFIKAQTPCGPVFRKGTVTLIR